MTLGEKIKEARKKAGLSQQQLAEQMNVSRSAVAKWESDKGIPDIYNLKTLANLLGVTIDFLIDSNQDTRKIKNKRIIKTCVIISVIAILLYLFPVYHIAQVWYPIYYDTEEMSLLTYRGSIKDQIIAAEIMKEAEAAFSHIGLTEKEADEKYGALSRYCFAGDDEIVKEKHNLKLWTAHFDSDYIFNRVYTESHLGYMWVHYNQQGFNKKGENVSGSWNIPALWVLDKNKAGEWEVVEIREAP